ncbi:hypothetical protein [Niabella aurantiaca]|uniref:hypothetical protein n=1 Tax=Niabella aurantiaca TaxID=379900 RepID=UPI0003676870|nr:hypothetical protein [Niabella aurantiaca]
MKTAELNNLPVPVLLAEIPEGWTIGDKSALGPHTSTSVHGEHIGRQKVWYFPKGYELVGSLSEMHQEDFDELVEWFETGEYYIDYRIGGWNGDITASESFDSAIEAAGYSISDDNINAHLGKIKEKYKELEISMPSAQDKVLDLERIYVFKKFKDNG